MKIKEVMACTGLTDRAIRLYIANGLIVPQNQKSYTGRNSYDFTEADLTRLQQIALLRKAEFSLEQIKALQAGGDSARSALRDYLKERQEEYQRDEKVLQALKDVLCEDIPSVEELCHRLEKGFRENPLPGEDLVISFKERVKNTVGWTAWVVSAAIYGWMCLSVFVETMGRFPFLKVSWEYINVLNIIVTVILLIPGAILLITLVSMIRHGVAKTGAVIMAMLLSIFVVPPSISILHVLPPVYSQTDDPQNYLQVGDDVRAFMEDIYLVFPAQIPGAAVAQPAHRLEPAIYADKTVYHYWYEYGFAPELDILAQWELPQDALLSERERIFGFGEKYQIQRENKGNWECFTIAFNQNLLQTDSCIFKLVFACNEETGMVRYIAYVSVSGSGEQWREGYFEKIDW